MQLLWMVVGIFFWSAILVSASPCPCSDQCCRYATKLWRQLGFAGTVRFSHIFLLCTSLLPAIYYIWWLQVSRGFLQLWSFVLFCFCLKLLESRWKVKLSEVCSRPWEGFQSTLKEMSDIKKCPWAKGSLLWSIQEVQRRSLLSCTWGTIADFFFKLSVVLELTVNSRIIWRVFWILSHYCTLWEYNHYLLGIENVKKDLVKRAYV